MLRKRKTGKNALPRFWHDCFVMVVCIGGASALCALLLPISSTDSHVPLIFVLAVLLAARYTTGYWFGLVTALLAVLGVNYVITYPYFDLNFTMTATPRKQKNVRG